MQEKLENDFSTFPCSTLFGVAVYSDTAISVLGKLNQVFASLHSPNYWYQKPCLCGTDAN